MRDAGLTLPRLAGLPIVVKDNINTAALPTTGGTAALRGVQPKANAPSLQQLLDAGAIVIGKSNLHELAFGITSTNLTPFAGAVKNPYDRTRIPGGSSGGTAAAIAARIVPAGLGTDTGGSTRVPAALCGIVGLRPSVGNGGAQRRYTDTNAVVPISHTRDTVGPMARTVADVALLDAVITGSPLPKAALLPGLRIGVPASFWEGMDAQLATVVTQARSRLAQAGVVFVDIDLPGLQALNNSVSFQLALHEPIADIPAYLAATGVSGITLADIAAKVSSPDVKGAFGAILADAFGKDYDIALRVHRPKLQALYADYFAANRLDAMLFPDHRAARRAHRPGGRLGQGVDQRRAVGRHLRQLHPQHRPRQQCRHPGAVAAGRPDGWRVAGGAGTGRAVGQRPAADLDRAGLRGGVGAACRRRGSRARSASVMRCSSRAWPS